MAAKDLTGTDPDFAARYTAAVAEIEAELGVVVRIVSAYRSNEEQARLYDGWVRRLPGYNPAAPPGSSNHNRGLAIDIAPSSTPAMREVFARFGIHFPLDGRGGRPLEWWHAEPMSTRGLPMPPFPMEDEMTPEQMAEIKAHVDERIDVGLDDLEAAIKAHVDLVVTHILNHVNGAHDGTREQVAAHVDEVGEKGRRHSKIMADSIIDRLD